MIAPQTAHNPEVAGSNPAPATEKPRKRGFLHRPTRGLQAAPMFNSHRTRRLGGLDRSKVNELEPTHRSHELGQPLFAAARFAASRVVVSGRLRRDSRNWAKEAR